MRGISKIGTQMYFQNIRRISVVVTLSNTKLNGKKVLFRTEKARDE